MNKKTSGFFIRSTVYLLIIAMLLGVQHFLYMKKNCDELHDFYVKSIARCEQMQAEQVELRRRIEIINAKLDEEGSEKVDSSIMPAKVKTTMSCINSFDDKIVPIVKCKSTQLELPYGNCSFYGYMDYTAVTDSTSEQYKLREKCWIDPMGLYRYHNDYVIALGSYYGCRVGERYRISLENGMTFNAVLGDIKNDSDTDITNRYRETYDERKNVIEFIVDISSLDPYVKETGNIGTYDLFCADITGIEKII